MHHHPGKSSSMHPGAGSSDLAGPRSQAFHPQGSSASPVSTPPVFPRLGSSDPAEHRSALIGPLLTRGSQLLPGLLIALMPKCPLCASVYLQLFGITGVSLMHYYSWIMPMLIIMLASGIIISYMKARRTRSFGTMYLSLAGTFLILAGKIPAFANIPSAGRPSSLLVYLGIGCLTLSAVLQVVRSAKSCRVSCKKMPMHS